jgi:hypothetical protein
VTRHRLWLAFWLLGCTSEASRLPVRACQEAPNAVGEWRRIPVGLETGGGEMTVVWAESEMLVWGGDYCNFACAKGARFNPTTDEWVPMRNEGAAPRSMASGVWTGDKFLVWGPSERRNENEQDFH